MNYSALGRDCGLSYQSIRRHLLDLEQAGVVRLLRPLGEGAGKRPAPVLYLRDAARLAELPHEQRYRARLVEELAGHGRIGYLARPQGAVVAPVLELPAAAGPARVGFAFCRTGLPRRRMWAALTRAQRQGLLRQGFVLYPGRRAFFSAARVAVVPDAVFLGAPGDWLAAALEPSPKALQTLMRRCNARAG